METGGFRPKASPARCAIRVCPVYAQEREPTEGMEEYFLSPQIAQRFGGQENMTTERVVIHSSPLSLWGLQGLRSEAQVLIIDKHA